MRLPAAGRRGRTAARFARIGPWLVAIAAVLVLILVLWASSNAERFTGAAPRLAVSAPGRLAVLPWINATSDPAYDWTSVGLMEVVARMIGDTPGVETVPASWVVRAVRRRGLDVADDAARERARMLSEALGAALVLETTLRRLSGGMLRLEATLWRGATDEASVAYEDSDVMALAERLADGVVRGLNPDALRVRMDRVLTGEPFFDRLYAMGVDALRGDRIDDAASLLQWAVDGRPRFLLARAGLAECAVARGDLEAAREGLVTVLEEAQGRGDQALQASTLLALSDVAARRGADDEADELARQAESIYAALGDRAGQLETLDVRSRIALAGRRASRAEAVFVEMLQAQRALGNRLGEVETLRQLGSGSLEAGDLDAAADLLGESRALARSLGDVAAEVHIVASLGEVAARREDWQQAEQLWAEALTHYRQRNDQRRMLLLGEKRARLLWHEGALDSAEAQYEDVQTLAVALGDQASEGRSALALADILLRKGYAYQAAPQLERALALDRQIDQPRRLQRVIARMAFARKNHVLAVDTMRTVRAQAPDEWSEDDAALLARFERALEAASL